MSTLYDLFKVQENATQEEIRNSYDNIIKKADSLPQNEKIIEQVRRVKIAYGILSDPEKRKRYDLDLATKRADELLENVQVREENETVQQNPLPVINEERIKQEIENQLNYAVELQSRREPKENLNQRKQFKQEQFKKQARKQERKDRRRAKKEQQLKQEMEMNAYGAYLQRQGYQVKYPWTWLRVKRLLISIFSIVIMLLILWHIPFVRKALTDLYNENFVVRFLADTIFSIFNWFIEMMKSIFKQTK